MPPPPGGSVGTWPRMSGPGGAVPCSVPMGSMPAGAVVVPMQGRVPYRTIRGPAPGPTGTPVHMSGSVRSVASSPAPKSSQTHPQHPQHPQPHSQQSGQSQSRQPSHPSSRPSQPSAQAANARPHAAGEGRSRDERPRETPSRTSSVDSHISGVSSGVHFRTPSRDSADFRPESRFYSGQGQRSPSVESSRSLQKVQTNLHQSRQHMQEVEQTMQAMRGALETSQELLRKSVMLDDGAGCGGGPGAMFEYQEHPEPKNLEDLAHRLQAQQEATLSKLTQRWEQRFAALESALSSGLEVAAAATTSMNERLTRFVSLAEVLEGAVERVIHSSKDIATLSRKVGQIEDDVACLAQELASDRKDRSEAVSLAQLDAVCEELRRDLRRPVSSDFVEGSGGPGGSGSPQATLSALSQALGEERAERLRLSSEQRRFAAHAERLEQMLQGATEQLALLARAQEMGASPTTSTSTSSSGRLALLASRGSRRSSVGSGSGSRALSRLNIGPIEEGPEEDEGTMRPPKGWEAEPSEPQSDGGIFSRILGR